MERLSIDEVIAHCNRQTRDYERLNGKTELENADISLNFIKQYWEHRQVGEWLRELKTYKDAEEQGLFLKLPCKAGDTLYIPFSRPKYIKECKVIEVKFDGCDLHIITDFATFSQRDIGKVVFLTREQADVIADGRVKE